MAFKMRGANPKGLPMKSPMKDDEFVDAGMGVKTNLHKGDPKIERGKKGHIHSTQFLAAAELSPPKKNKKDE